jgi:DNA-binding response OmpR family regulator
MNGAAGTNSRLVVVVDDNPAVRRAVSVALSRNGYHAIQAADVGDALDLVETSPTPVTAVISEVALPGLPVVFLVQSLRNWQPVIPILLISGGARDPDTATAISRLKVPFLAKPFAANELIERLEELLTDGYLVKSDRVHNRMTPQNTSPYLYCSGMVAAPE